MNLTASRLYDHCVFNDEAGRCRLSIPEDAEPVLNAITAKNCNRRRHLQPTITTINVGGVKNWWKSFRKLW